MFARTVFTTLVLVLVTCANAIATPQTVNLRVEGETQTYFEGPVTTDGHDVTSAAGGTHPCDGTQSGAPGPAGPTQLTALDDAKAAGGYDWDGRHFGFDFFVERIAGDGQVGVFGAKSWATHRNNRFSTVGPCQERVFNSDEVLFAWSGSSGPPNFDPDMVLKLSAARATATTGEGIPVNVQQHAASGTAAPAAGAAIQGQTAGADGAATIAFDSPGVKRFKATKAGTVRSNAVEVCVEAPGSGSCSGFVPAGTAARDAKKPRGRLTSLRNGKRYRRGPRLLKGIARDEGGVRDVRLRLNRIASGGCADFDAKAERFARSSRCRGQRFFSVGSNAAWSYLLPERLGPGRYTLTLKIVDQAGNSRVSRVRFTVIR